MIRSCFVFTTIMDISQQDVLQGPHPIHVSAAFSGNNHSEDYFGSTNTAAVRPGTVSVLAAASAVACPKTLSSDFCCISWSCSAPTPAQVRMAEVQINNYMHQISQSPVSNLTLAGMAGQGCVPVGGQQLAMIRHTLMVAKLASCWQKKTKLGQRGRGADLLARLLRRRQGEH